MDPLVALLKALLAALRRIGLYVMHVVEVAARFHLSILQLLIEANASQNC